MGRRPFVREKILEAAFDLVARRGYEAVSSREIAEAAGVGRASMYRHFAGMEELGRELYRVALAPLVEEFSELDASTPRWLLIAAVRMLYRAYDRRPRALALLVFPPHDFVPWELDRRNRRSLRNALRRGLGVDQDLAAVVWGAITGPLQDRYLHRRRGRMAPHADAHARRVIRLLPSDRENRP